MSPGPLGGGGGPVGGSPFFEESELVPVVPPSVPGISGPVSLIVPMTLFADISYVAGVGQLQFVIPFPFLKESHVTVTIDDLTQTDVSIDASAGVLTLGPTVPALAGGEIVRLFRLTPADETDLIVDFVGGAVVSDEDLDTNTRQLLFIAQEARDEAQRVATLFQQVQVTSGNLPSVTSGDNNKSLYVKSSTWKLQTPTQARTVLGLSTRATTPFVEHVSVAELQSSPTVALEMNVSADWTEAANTKLPISTLSDLNDTTPDVSIAGGANDLKVITPGKYRVRVSVNVGLAGPASDQRVQLAITDEVNGPAQVVFLKGDEMYLSDGPTMLTFTAEILRNTTGQQFFAVRARALDFAGSAIVFGPSQIVIERLRD